MHDATAGVARTSGHPEAPADLLAHRCIGHAGAATADVWQLTDGNGEVHAVMVDRRMHTHNGDTARAAALADRAIGRNDT